MNNPDTTRTELRDRIRRAVCEAEGFAWGTDMLEPDEYGEVADAVLAVLLPSVCRARVLHDAALSGPVRQFLTFALDLAADEMASRGNEFGDEDEAALEALRRVAAEEQPAETQARPVPLATVCARCPHPFNWHDRKGCQFGNEVNRCGCAAFVPGERPAPVDPRSILGVGVERPIVVEQPDTQETRRG